MASRPSSPRGWGSITPYRGGRFRVRIYIDEQRVERIVPTQDIAKLTLAALQKRKAEVEAGVSSPAGMAEDVRVSDVIPEVLAAMKSGATHVYATSTLRTYGIEFSVLGRSPVGGRRIASLRDRDVVALGVWLREGGAGTSHIRHVYDRLAQVIEHAVAAGYVSRPPVRVKRPRYNRNTATWCPSELETAKLLAAGRRAYDRRVYGILLVGADAGPRLGEIANLRVRDIDLDHDLIRIESRGEATDRTKTGDPRIVPIRTTRLRTALAALTRGREPEEHLFGFRDREALSDLTGAAWREVFGFEPRWNGLRRRFATHSALAGVPVPIIQAWLGHKSITTTMGYIRIPAETLLRGVDGGLTRGAETKKRGKSKRRGAGEV